MVSYCLFYLFIFNYIVFRFYGPAQMKEAPRAEFEKWYAANKDKPFDFQKELEYYCHLDVDILTKGCLRFREILMKVCFLDYL